MITCRKFMTPLVPFGKPYMRHPFWHVNRSRRAFSNAAAARDTCGSISWFAKSRSDSEYRRWSRRRSSRRWAEASVDATLLSWRRT